MDASRYPNDSDVDSNRLRFEVADLTERLRTIESTLVSVRERNARVELDKKWETSTTRFISVTLITYLTMNLILWSIHGPFPPVHAIVPTCGYMLSTLSLPWVRRAWNASKRRLTD